jgi:uncharacterized protein
MKHYQLKKIENLANRITPVLKRNGVSAAALFGSFARGQDNPSSDIDILVTYREGITLLDVAGLQFELEKILGRKVDLVSEKYLHSRIRDSVKNEQIRIL